MASDYYKPCKELDECEELINKYYLTAQYEKCFEGHLKLAEKGYPLAANDGHADAKKKYELLCEK